MAWAETSLSQQDTSLLGTKILGLLQPAGGDSDRLQQLLVVFQDAGLDCESLMTSINGITHCSLSRIDGISL